MWKAKVAGVQEVPGALPEMVEYFPYNAENKAYLERPKRGLPGFALSHLRRYQDMNEKMFSHREVGFPRGKTQVFASS